MKYYISFGQTHTHSAAGVTIDKDCLVVVNAKDWDDAMYKAKSRFGNKFANIYDAHESDHFIEHFPRGVVMVIP